MLRDELYWLTLTVIQEAGAEPYEGQLAVAWVIANRARVSGTSISDTVLKPWQFSAWNTDSPTRRMADADERDQRFAPCYQASCAAYFKLADDPSFAATHYLNPAVLKRLPSWYDKDKITVTIGRHVFLRL